MDAMTTVCSMAKWQLIQSTAGARMPFEKARPKFRALQAQTTSATYLRRCEAVPVMDAIGSSTYVSSKSSVGWNIACVKRAMRAMNRYHASGAPRDPCASRL
eukprot:15535685-Heterocapsa_arctica.AAC.1